MSANRIYLVCSQHKSPEHALLIAERADNETQFLAASNKRADAWFAKHQVCARGCDHFQVAYERPCDWDVSPPAEKSVAGGVRIAMVNGSKPS
jgi:hypothetical protein